LNTAVQDIRKKHGFMAYKATDTVAIHKQDPVAQLFVFYSARVTNSNDAYFTQYWAQDVMQNIPVRGEKRNKQPRYATNFSRLDITAGGARGVFACSAIQAVLDAKIRGFLDTRFIGTAQKQSNPGSQLQILVRQ
jgi:hypothetical protein